MSAYPLCGAIVVASTVCVAEALTTHPPARASDRGAGTIAGYIGAGANSVPYRRAKELSKMIGKMLPIKE